MNKKTVTISGSSLLAVILIILAVIFLTGD